MSNDYEDRRRPFRKAVKDWAIEMGFRRAVAAEVLGVKLDTYNGWCDGRPCGQERAIRKLMALLAEKDRARRPIAERG